MTALPRTAALLLLLAPILPIHAQGYPNKPIRVIVPYAAGGNMEHWRPTLIKVSQILGVSMVMENRPGAGGNVGTDHVAKSAPDGYNHGNA